MQDTICPWAVLSGGDRAGAHRLDRALLRAMGHSVSLVCFMSGKFTLLLDK